MLVKPIMSMLLVSTFIFLDLVREAAKEGAKPKSSFCIFYKNFFKHPFYPILIPNTPYVKFSLFFFLVVGGSKNLKNIIKYYFN